MLTFSKKDGYAGKQQVAYFDCDLIGLMEFYTDTDPLKKQQTQQIVLCVIHSIIHEWLYSPCKDLGHLTWQVS
jgi:hypothetical protein